MELVAADHTLVWVLMPSQTLDLGAVAEPKTQADTQGVMDRME